MPFSFIDCNLEDIRNDASVIARFAQIVFEAREREEKDPLTRHKVAIDLLDSFSNYKYSQDHDFDLYIFAFYFFKLYDTELMEILDKRFTMAIQTDPKLSVLYNDPHFKMAMALGVEKGLKRGWEEGLKRGLEKGREETASAMLTAGRYARAEISEICGLSMHKLRRLAKELKLSA
jgi:hypothetical protein